MQHALVTDTPDTEIGDGDGDGNGNGNDRSFAGPLGKAYEAGDL